MRWHKTGGYCGPRMTTLKRGLIIGIKYLIDPGFAEKGADGKTVIPDHRLHNIIKMDETCLSLDGSKGTRGGRPEAIFYDPRLPRLGKATSKSGKATTMITGSTAAGEALLPHFQFQLAAQSEETMKLRVDMVQYMQGVRGKFGCKDIKEWDCTFGMNTKGGMDDEEFTKYCMNSIVPLWPDSKDVKGHRVMIKADSGPGRTCV